MALVAPYPTLHRLKSHTWLPGLPYSPQLTVLPEPRSDHILPYHLRLAATLQPPEPGASSHGMGAAQARHEHMAAAVRGRRQLIIDVLLLPLPG